MNPIFTVTQINNYSKSLLENKLHKVFVKGEVSSINSYGSLYTYFLLKDSDSAISCVIFNKNTNLRTGQLVTVFGNVTLYTQKGKFQIIIKDILLSGQGELWIKFNKVKKCICGL